MRLRMERLPPRPYAKFARGVFFFKEPTTFRE